MRQIFLLVPLLLLQLSCSDRGLEPDNRHFNLLLKYGPGGHGQLNTFNDTVTKDLGTTTSTGRLVLSHADLDSIESRLRRINIFSFPDTFVVQTGDTVGTFTPSTTYILKLSMDSRWKNLYWKDCVLSSDPRVVHLRETLTFIVKVVESYPEYKALGPPVGYI